MGFLTVQNVYAEITQSFFTTKILSWRNQLLKWHLPTKAKLFTWLMIGHKLNTWDNLQKKGWTGPNTCHLCYKDAKSADHLFIMCSYTKSVWGKISSVLDLKTPWDGTTLADCFDSWFHKEHSTKNLPSLVCWSIWLDRNIIIF